MTIGPTEAYRPRTVLRCGVWEVGPVRFKIYGLLADGQELTDEMSAAAEQFLQSGVLTRVDAMGDSNGLGFVIIHPGDLGLSISAHWWVQGCVLCQHMHRQLYGAREPMDATSRPVIGCVWELGLIQAEQEAWRVHMMGDAPDAPGYLGQGQS
ncbi:hypothetical protein [Actibacterium sp. 188UL27-1]|uniref:hypothetical protein n=1 Tax=Actibacterium sp. 188UL27-1 TaxID=2786961 RepID=UPI00195ABB0B|nr:hypothetical protein [Actibacterium sp. 188UL27-1]MBM7068935.1 hypothetical protein [Actibacterium sp. 188UL27-1]